MQHEDVPWSFLCPDGSDQELDYTCVLASRSMQIRDDAGASLDNSERGAARARAVRAQIWSCAIVLYLSGIPEGLGSNG